MLQVKAKSIFDMAETTTVKTPEVKTKGYDLPRELDEFEVKGPFASKTAVQDAYPELEFLLLVCTSDNADPASRRIFIVQPSNIRMVKTPDFYYHCAIHPEWSCLKYYPVKERKEELQWFSHTSSVRVLPDEIESYNAVLHAPKRLYTSQQIHVTVKAPAIKRGAHEQHFRTYSVS